MKRIAVVLSGCGHLDGAEIRESVLTLLALETQDVSYQIYAPDQAQHHVVNHLTSEASAGDTRNVLQEAARIARGKVSPLTELDPNDFAALIMPGGFGAAKNLSTFASQGSEGTVNDTLGNIIQGFYQANKPIGAICIAPAIVALVLGKHNPTITIGTDVDTATELEKLGVQHQSCHTDNIVVDTERLIVTTPAYMDESASLVDVNSGISKLVSKVVEII